MKVLLTGATGFVGRNFLLRTLADGGEAFVPVRSRDKLKRQLDQESTGPWERVHALDADPTKWPEHLPVDHALLSAGVLFARNREEYFETNVGWMRRLLCALPANCRVVILSSLSAGGPTPEGRAARAESDPDQPLTWYGESKLAMERMVREEFPERAITILRPPMILGPRDTATLPLFRMGRSRVRLKPALHAKSYSFLAVEDLVEGILAALTGPATATSHYVAAPEPITDWDLIAAAAEATGVRGATLPIPQPVVQLLAQVVDAVPALREQTPSLTRDRAREIWPARWVADGTTFEKLTGWRARRGLRETMQAAHDYYVAAGLL